MSRSSSPALAWRWSGRFASIFSTMRHTPSDSDGTSDAGRRRGGVAVVVDECQRAVTEEGRPAGEQVEERRAEAVDVRAGVEVGPGTLLRGEVQRRAEDRAGAGQAHRLRLVEVPGEAEVRELGQRPRRGGRPARSGSRVSRMLSGLMSRCRMPRSWTATRAWQTSAAIVRASRSGRARPSSRRLAQRRAGDELDREVVLAVVLVDLDAGGRRAGRGPRRGGGPP